MKIINNFYQKIKLIYINLEIILIKINFTYYFYFWNEFFVRRKLTMNQ